MMAFILSVESISIWFNLVLGMQLTKITQIKITIMLLNRWRYCLMAVFDVCVCVGLPCSIWQSGIWEASQGVSEGGAAAPEAAVGHIIQTAAQPWSRPRWPREVWGNWEGGGGREGKVIPSYRKRSTTLHWPLLVLNDFDKSVLSVHTETDDIKSAVILDMKSIVMAKQIPSITVQWGSFLKIKRPKLCIYCNLSQCKGQKLQHLVKNWYDDTVELIWVSMWLQRNTDQVMFLHTRSVDAVLQCSLDYPLFW